MNKYKIAFIDGNSLQYKVMFTNAESKEQALKIHSERYGAAFEHRILLIKENDNIIFEF